MLLEYYVTCILYSYCVLSETQLRLVRLKSKTPFLPILFHYRLVAMPLQFGDFRPGDGNPEIEVAVFWIVKWLSENNDRPIDS